MGTSGTNPTSGTTGTGQAATNTPAALPVALKVSFTLNTPDGLRQINFGLEKDSDGTHTNWTITFTLFERANSTASFGSPIVSLNVFVAQALHANAATAAQNGLTPAQAAQATGPAANAAKAAQEGTMPLPVANKIIQSSLS